MTGPSPRDQAPSGKATSGQAPARTNSSVRPATIAVGLVLALLVGILAWQVAVGSDETIRSGLVGRAAPEIVGTATDGTTVDIDRWRGSWVLVNFFATWCVPCIREHPELVEFSQRHQPGGPGVPVELVSVAFDDDPAAVRDFFDQRGGSWPVLVDDTGPIALDYGVRGVPESYLVSPAGQVVGVFFGVTADALDDVIDSWINATPSDLSGGAQP